MSEPLTLVWLADQRAAGSPNLYFPQCCDYNKPVPRSPAFSHGFWALNSGADAYVWSPLPTEPSPGLNLLFSLPQNEGVGKDQMSERQTRDCFVTGPGCWLVTCMVCSWSVIHKSCLFLIIGVYSTSPPALLKAGPWCSLLLFSPGMEGDPITFIRETRLISPGTNTTSEPELDRLSAHLCVHSSEMLWASVLTLVTP